jgi:hypothetical protein
MTTTENQMYYRFSARQKGYIWQGKAREAKSSTKDLTNPKNWQATIFSENKFSN